MPNMVPLNPKPINPPCRTGAIMLAILAVFAVGLSQCPVEALESKYHWLPEVSGGGQPGFTFEIINEDWQPRSCEIFLHVVYVGCTLVFRHHGCTTPHEEIRFYGQLIQHPHYVWAVFAHLSAGAAFLCSTDLHHYEPQQVRAMAMFPM